MEENIFYSVYPEEIKEQKKKKRKVKVSNCSTPSIVYFLKIAPVVQNNGISDLQ